MRTTVDLPDDLLGEVEELTGAPTRREALTIALRDYVRRARLVQLISMAGTLTFDVDPRELRNREQERAVS